MNDHSPAPRSRSRYSNEPLPRYRFVPGETPHPRRNRDGHSFGQPEPGLTTFQAALWRKSRDYRLGIDLFNFGYWWESHEVFEALWHACGPPTPEGRFFQGLVQLAAAHLKRRMGNSAAAVRLFKRACLTLHQAPAFCMGLDIARLVQDIERCSRAVDETPVVLRLDFSDEGMAERPGAP